MALPSSGQISMKDILDEKQGGTTARTNVSLKGLSVNGTNDYQGVDITGTPDGNAPYGITEFYDFSLAAFPTGTVDSFNWFGTNPGNALSQEAPVLTWGNVSRQGTETSVQVSCQVGFKKDTSNTRIIMQEGNGNSGTGTSLNLHYLSYTGHDSTTFQAKCTYTTSAGSPPSGVTYQAPASYSPASGTYANISTSSFTPLWFWSVTNTGFSPASFSSSSPHPLWHVRAGTTNSATTIDGPGTGNAISLSAQRGTGGGFGGGGGGDFCVHEDHKISTADGLKTIQEVIDTCPKVWSWNNTTQEKELVDIAVIHKIKHNNLWKLNNLKVTEDHIVYIEGYQAKAVRPDLATQVTGNNTVEHLVTGDKLMKEDGTTEGLTVLEEYPGEYWTYTIGNPNGNFYADGLLVDSEVKIAPQGSL